MSPPPGAITYDLLGETLWLMPQRAIYWPARKTCVVADVHLGKDATFGANHINMPQKSTGNDLQRLSEVLQQVSAERLLILGDLLHAPIGTTPRVHSLFKGWREHHAELDIHWIRGNHDHDLPELDPPLTHHPRELVDEPFVFRHHPGKSEKGYVLAGHLHPGLPLHLQGERLRLPCFNFRKKWGVLPAFSLFTGLYDLPRRKGTHAVISDDSVLVLP